ncbi:MAG: hypothetical protein KC419_00185, partial [Anaerolineales bacterium]|nr:hypothetical protein [Anaerolineales bacterium]
AEHEPFTIPQSRFFERIRNDEWNGIDLPETDDAETAVHCGFCLHYTKTYDPLLFIPVIIGLAFFMAAPVMIALFQISIWHAVQLVLLGIAYFVVSTWGFIISEDYHFLMMRKDRTPIPFWGKFPPARVRIVESAHGKITLDSDGMYNLQVKNTSGVLHFLLQLTESDDDRLYQYRQKYGLRDFEEELFLTGFAVLHGTERLRSKSGIRAPKELNFIQLKDSTDTLPHLNRSAYHRQWQYDQKYAFTFENQHSSGFPVHIVPSLISEGDEWGLELYVQVNPDIDASLLSKPKVQILELETRDFSGEVETFVPAAKKTSNTSRNQHKIIWQNLMLKTNEPVMNKSFYVRFANSRNIKPDFIIEGTLTLKFEGAIS